MTTAEKISAVDPHAEDDWPAGMDMLMVMIKQFPELKDWQYHQYQKPDGTILRWLSGPGERIQIISKPY